MIDKSDYTTDDLPTELVDKLFDLINTRDKLRAITDSINDPLIKDLFEGIESGWFRFVRDEAGAALNALEDILEAKK